MGGYELEILVLALKKNTLDRFGRVRNDNGHEFHFPLDLDDLPRAANLAPDPGVTLDEIGEKDELVLPISLVG